MNDPRRVEYADWYVWAKRNLASDAAVCHGAAAAALRAIEAGGDRVATITAARASMTSAAHLDSGTSPHLRAYAEWFDWCRREFGGTRDQQHAAAAAAMDVLDAGGDPNQATLAARRAHTPGPDAGVPAEAAPVPEWAPATAAAYPPPPPTVPPPTFGAPPPVVPSGGPPPPANHAAAPSAGAGSRLLGWAVDMGMLLVAWILISLVVGLCLGIGFAIGGADPNRWLAVPANQFALGLLVIALVVVVSWLYGTLSETSSLQGTFGRVVAGTRLVTETGDRVSYRAANSRWLMKLLTLGAGGLLIPFNPSHHALWDVAAGTRVVRR